MEDLPKEEGKFRPPRSPSIQVGFGGGSFGMTAAAAVRRRGRRRGRSSGDSLCAYISRRRRRRKGGRLGCQCQVLEFEGGRGGEGPPPLPPFQSPPPFPPAVLKAKSRTPPSRSLPPTLLRFSSLSAPPPPFSFPLSDTHPLRKRAYGTSERA